MLHEQSDYGSNSISQSKPLHDSENANLVDREGIVLEAENGKPADANSNQENDHGPFENFQTRGNTEGEIVLSQRNVRGDSHNEHKEWEYQIGRS